jgi:mono/diheme cytochrome c family protein
MYYSSRRICYDSTVKAHHTWLLAGLGALSACTPATPGASAPAGTAPSAQESGGRIYSGNCIACHQQNARGIPGVYPSLAGSPVVLGDPKALALWVVKGQRTASMPAGRYATAMPQYGWMSAADTAALLTYLRSNFGNAAAPVATASVADALGD